MIKEKITQRFDTVEVPRTITINDISLAMNINLVSNSKELSALWWTQLYDKAVIL